MHYQRWRTFGDPVAAGKVQAQHGHAGHGHASPEYYAWQDMKCRCLTPSHASYKGYGGRGITTCQRWKDDFLAFLADMGPRPSPDHSLDRIDNDGPYCPENCQWSTRQEQMRNRRCSVTLTVLGITKLMIEWAEELGMDYFLMWNRKKRGWTDSRILTTPVRGGR